jgi:hypothetical protein
VEIIVCIVWCGGKNASPCESLIRNIEHPLHIMFLHRKCKTWSWISGFNQGNNDKLKGRHEQSLWPSLFDVNVLLFKFSEWSLCCWESENTHVIGSFKFGLILKFNTGKWFGNPMHCFILVALFSKVVKRNSMWMFVELLCLDKQEE